jgi:hypothetical protein
VEAFVVVMEEVLDCCDVWHIQEVKTRRTEEPTI